MAIEVAQKPMDTASAAIAYLVALVSSSPTFFKKSSKANLKA
jgi:hypothetical protein